MITTQEQLMQVLRGKVDASFDIALLEDDIDQVVDGHVLPILGEDILDKIKQLDAASPMYNLHKSLARTIAYMALHNYLKTGAVHVSSAGILRYENGDNKSAYRYQEERLRNTVKVDAWRHWERVLELLDDYAFRGGDFADIGDLVKERKEVMDLNRGLIVPFSKYVREYHGTDMDRLTFETLRPILRSLEREGVAFMMGADAYSTFMRRYLENESLSEFDLNLLPLLREALCLEAVAEGLRRFMVQITDGRVVLNESSISQDDRQQVSPDAMKLAPTSDHLRRFRTNALDAARRYMDANAAEFEGYVASSARSSAPSPVHRTTGIVAL